MKSHFLISDEEKNRIRNLHESRLESFGTGNVIKEQTTEKWVINSGGETVGTFDDKRKLKFIANKKGKESGLESGPSLPSGTKIGKPRNSGKSGDDQSWIKTQSQKKGNSNTLSQVLGLLRPSRQLEILQKCKVPTPPKCRGKNIMKDEECKKAILAYILTDPGKYKPCLSKATSKYRN